MAQIIEKTRKSPDQADRPVDLRTDWERWRDEKWERIRARYKALAAKYPDAKPSRLFAIISREFEMTMHGVRNVVISGGLYTPRKHTRAGEARQS